MKDSLMFKKWGRFYNGLGYYNCPVDYFICKTHECDLCLKQESMEEFNRLEKNYSSKGRLYHNFKHIEECLKEFSEAKHLSKEPNALEFAIWYHDIVYDTKRKDNEEKSAAIAYNSALRRSLDYTFAARVKEIILATDHLRRLPKTIDEKLIADIDLSKLGKPEKEFGYYEKKLRKEYIWVPEELFRKGRARIVEQFLERGTIFFTEFFIEKYEKKARDNLKRSFKRLAG